MEFFMTIVLEGLENKYNMELSRDWKMLKNKKFFGSVSEQNIRTKSRPLIQEMDSSPTLSSSSSREKIDSTHKALISEVVSRENEKNAKTQNPLISEIQSSAETPEYIIFSEPPDGNPSFLVAEISLPKVTSVRSLLLDLGEDRIVLWARPELYHLDIYIPFDILQEESGAQFNRSTKVLTVTMPIKPK
ncbi:PIH1 domain-containing protein 1 [Protopterus annectens]|uniref:PIH1 domain-containing protein 1 n=1 Tax=Protopterus annectens TaxID=7888 RepID=UPI001CFB885F|nr:PIH1 domain-containing protein 1 [Protopterus annectens]